METIKTIDVKGLAHTQREQLIFPGIEGLGEGETARIVVEFNPIPLVYTLNARNEFNISYEKEGPDEWVLRVRREVSSPDRKEHLKKLLRQIKGEGVSEEAKERAKELFQAVDAKTIGILEQELIQEGVSHDEIRRSLCDIHLEVLRDSLVAKRIEVESPHPVHTLMEEHKEILHFLNELGVFVERLNGANRFKSVEKDFEKLKEIALHLVEAEKHHQREEEVIFPRLEKHGISEPPAIMKEDHVEFRKRKQRLFQIAQNPRSLDFADFKQEVVELGRFLTRELESHIFKEDNILYQIALQVFTEEEWKEVKRECDKIGYCCYTPEDQKK